MGEAFYRQEYFGEFVDLVNAVFALSHIERALDEDLEAVAI